MTDQTVPVPVDLARRLIASFPAHSAVVELKALIPIPPKVGDVLTADQVRDLPSASVMRDEDGDILVKVGDEVRRVTMDLQYADSVRWGAYEVPGLLRVYTLTLVSLPAGD